MALVNEYFCAGCGSEIYYAKSTGISSVYSAKDSDFAGKDILLCEPCFFAEEAQIDAEGTNNLPHVLDRYRSTLANLGELRA
jgi:hypothetical protein